MNKLGIKVLRPDARIPRYAHPGDSGLDLVAPGPTVHIPPFCRHKFDLGLALQLPEGFEGQIRPRSGKSYKAGLFAWGTIDQGYTGEISVVLLNLDPDHGSYIRPGDKIAQLVIAPVEKCEVVEVDFLNETSRGDGGFGSTGS